MWCDLRKSVGTRTCDIFSFLFDWNAHLERYILLKNPFELVNAPDFWLNSPPEIDKRILYEKCKSFHSKELTLKNEGLQWMILLLEMVCLFLTMVICHNTGNFPDVIITVIYACAIQLAETHIIFLGVIYLFIYLFFLRDS